MVRKVKTLLVDDELNSLQVIRNLLERYGPGFEVVDTAMTGTEAIEKIQALEPELVFLDITLPDCDGFFILDRCREVSFEVIFVTAHDNYAIKAFELAAIHYLLKPVSHLEFQEALSRFLERRETTYPVQRHQILQESIRNKPDKIVLPSLTGFTIITLDEIIRCQAESNYTLFFLTDQRKVMVSRTLNFYDNLLTDLQFCRVHNKHIVNLHHIQKFVRGKGGTLIMADQAEVDISESRKKEFLSRLKDHAMGV
ncbi:MAG: LytTR family DNA-binding domain-containing protein [Bacteroidota bacterium]